MRYYIEFKQLTEYLGTPEYHMFQDIQDGENGFSNPAFNMTYWEYKEWLRQEQLRSQGECLPDGWVPYTTYVLYIDAEPVGYGRVRHSTSKTLETHGCGPIGYAIAKEHRGKGYGAILFQELLEKCKSVGYKAIQLYPLQDNVASIKVMQKCGGEIIGTMHSINEEHTEQSKTIVYIDLLKGIKNG